MYGAECVDYYTVTAISEERNFTCATRVTVVGYVCLSVCLSVCPLINILWSQVRGRLKTDIRMSFDLSKCACAEFKSSKGLRACVCRFTHLRRHRCNFTDRLRMRTDRLRMRGHSTSQQEEVGHRTLVCIVGRNCSAAIMDAATEVGPCTPDKMVNVLSTEYGSTSGKL